MSTEANLKEAFAGESQANRKYSYFAKKECEELIKSYKEDIENYKRKISQAEKELKELQQNS